MQNLEEAVQSFRQAEGQPLPRVTLGAVNADGTLNFSQTYGDEGSTDKSETDAVHWISSCTKFITTIAVMQCVERGQLTLDGDISLVLPEWKNPQILTGFDENNKAEFRSAKKAITLRHLLTHSSGMGYVHMHPLLAKYSQLTGRYAKTGKTIRESYFPFLLFEPGEHWLYSPSIDFAGLMNVENANGGIKLGEYMTKHIFEPLSIQDITFHLDQRPDLQSRKLKLWERVGSELEEVKDFWWPDPVIDDFGGAGLYTTVTELLKLYSGFLRGELLRSETIKDMFKPHLENSKDLENRHSYDLASRNAIYNAVPSSVPADFGLGGLLNMVSVPGGRAAHSLTWSGLPNCFWWVDPMNQVASVYLSQLLPTGDQKAVELVRRFEEIVFATIAKS